MDVTRRRVVMLVAAAGFSQAADAQQSQANPEATAKALRDALSGLVRFEVVRRAGTLREDGAKEVDSFVGNGVKTLQDRNEINNGYSVSIAIDGARRLGVEIMTQAQKLRADLKQIGADSVQAATKTLCPLFPFC